LIDNDEVTSKNKRNSFIYLLSHYFSFSRKLNKKKKIDLIVSSHPISGLFLVIYYFINSKKRSKWIHWFTGQVWATQSGLVKYLYKYIDKLICRKASYVYCDSFAQVKFLKSEGFDRFQNLTAPGLGSINGVPKELFDDPAKLCDKNNIRLGYVGRINQDKGIFEILKEFASWPTHNISLEIYGEIDDTTMEQDFLNQVSKIPNVNYYGGILDKRLVYSNIDILIQPSFREGFSNVLIEAQAQCIPVIVRDIYGVKDAYQDGVTGLRFQSEREIYKCINLIAGDKVKFSNFQIQSRAFARKFVSENVLEKITRLYISCAVEK
jgi:glycosyltransferase involved in cell wall biosynthesis